MKKHKKNAGPKSVHHRKPARHNPFFKRSKASRRRRHNPGLASRVGGWVRSGIVAILGAFVTRQVPQMLLGAQNAGMLGYAANAATALMTATLTSKYVSQQDGMFVGIGGAVYFANRVITEQFSEPISSLRLAGVGDVQAGIRGMDGLRPGYFNSPPAYNQDGTPAVPAAIREAITAAVRNAQPPAKSLEGRRSLRFAA